MPVCTPLLLLLSGLDWWSWAADVKVPLQGFHMIPVRRKINVYSVSMCYTSTAWATNTNTLDSSNVRTLLHPPPLASLALSYFSVARVLSLTPPDSPLPPVFRSLDQLSVADVGWYSLYLPRPSLHSFTPTSSPLQPCEHMAGFGASTHNSFNKFISSLEA